MANDPKLKPPCDESTVLLTGASSQLGIFLLPRLLEAGYRVVAISRQASVRPTDLEENPSWIHPDVLGRVTGEKRAEAIPRADVLISCGPMELARDLVELYPGLERAVIFSTSSVFSKAQSPDREESEKIAAIISAESSLASIADAHKLPLLVLRPTLIYGCGLDSNISLLASWIKRRGWLPVAGPASGLRQPVHADDLALVAVNALTRKRALALDSPACGGSTISYRQMIELIFDGLSKPRRIIRFPVGLLAAAIRLISALPSFKGLNQQMVFRQNLDLTFDDTPLREKLDYQPRPFKPTAADFVLPESGSKFQIGKDSGS